MMRFDSIWTEKYRPKKLEDLCISDNIREIVQSFGKEIPNLLFCGSPGSGKTTLARIIVESILECDYLYINASDENGVDTIRNKISGFVQTKSFNGEIKVVILDEADHLSNSAQAILRNLMETHANNARFIITGNYKHRITKPIQSRCQGLDIKPTIKDALTRCLNILKVENVQVDPEQKKLLAQLVKSHFPDLRKCINEMQKNCIGGKLKIVEGGSTNLICVKIHDAINSGKTLELRTYLIQNDGLFDSDWDQLLVDLHNYIYNSNVDDSQKKSIIITIADHLEKSSRVIDKEINFFACILNIENAIS